MTASPAIPDATRAISLGFVINDMSTEQENYTTIRLARTAVNRGHRVALVGLGGFIYDANDTVRAHAHVPAASHYESDAELLAELQGEQASTERISIEELDVLMLRSDPADEEIGRASCRERGATAVGSGCWRGKRQWGSAA